MQYDIVIRARIESNLGHEDLQQRLVAGVLDPKMNSILNKPGQAFVVVDYEQTSVTPDCYHLEFTQILDWYQCTQCKLEVTAEDLQHM